jgi:hypothetical protein
VFAAPVNFSGPYAVTALSSDPGLVIQTLTLNSPLNFTLSAGESTPFISLFDIWTDETFVNADDEVASPISVAFNFTPSTSPNTVFGTTVGDPSTGFLGAFQQGVLTWTDPVNFLFGVGGVLQVVLTDETFNTGLFGLTPGERKGATVKGMFTLISEPSVIPVPAALPLFAGGLGMLAWMSRRRRRHA